MSLSSGHGMQAEGDRICPITGLRQSFRPEWSYANAKGSYQVSLRVLGDRIMTSQNIGYATTEDVIESVTLANRVEAEAIAEGLPYVQILGFTDLEGISIEARKEYIEEISRNDRIRCMIFYGVSSIMKISIRLAKKINMIPFDTYIVNSYEEAVSVAMQSLAEDDDHLLLPPGEIGAKRSRPVQGRGPAGRSSPPPLSSDRIETYVDDLLDYIGSHCCPK